MLFKMYFHCSAVSLHNDTVYREPGKQPRKCSQRLANKSGQSDSPVLPGQYWWAVPAPETTTHPYNTTPPWSPHNVAYGDDAGCDLDAFGSLEVSMVQCSVSPDVLF